MNVGVEGFFCSIHGPRLMEAIRLPRAQHLADKGGRVKVKDHIGDFMDQGGLGVA